MQKIDTFGLRLTNDALLDREWRDIDPHSSVLALKNPSTTTSTFIATIFGVMGRVESIDKTPVSEGFRQGSSTSITLRIGSSQNQGRARIFRKCVEALQVLQDGSEDEAGYDGIVKVGPDGKEQILLNIPIDDGRQASVFERLSLFDSQAFTYSAEEIENRLLGAEADFVFVLRQYTLDQSSRKIRAFTSLAHLLD